MKFRRGPIEELNWKMLLTIAGVILVVVFGRELITSDTCKGLIELLR